VSFNGNFDNKISSIRKNGDYDIRCHMYVFHAYFYVKVLISDFRAGACVEGEYTLPVERTGMSNLRTND